MYVRLIKRGENKMNKSQLFKTAWTIAREGQQKFGGNVKEYFAESLKLAYKLQGGITMEFEMKKESRDFKNGSLLLITSKRQPAWLAEVDGLSGKYGLNRNFISENEAHFEGRCIAYDLSEGNIYNWSEEKGVQHFGIVEGGKLYEISKNDATNLVK